MKNDSQKNINQGGKQVVNNEKITEIISGNKSTKPEQYQEKVGDGVHSKPQPLKKK